MNNQPISGIYKITNIKNHKVYVGSSKNIDKRFEEHKRMLANNNHHSVKLQRSCNKTKDKLVFKFEIIEHVDDLDMLHDKEQYCIDLYNSFNKGYNCTEKVDNPKYCLKYLKKKERSDKSNKKFELVKNEFNKLYDELFERIDD